MDIKQSPELCWDLISWWRCAGDEAKNRLVEELTKHTESTILNQPYSAINKKPDMTYTVSFENDWYRLGDKLVYIYTTDEGVPFYVGMGDIYRPVNISSRSQAFLDEFQKHSYCKVYIIATNLQDTYAKDIETLCILFLINQNWKLTNVRKTQLFKDNYQVLLDDYPSIVEVLKKFNRACISKVLNEPSRYDKDIVKKSQRRCNSQNIWEIDGDIKSAREWCAIYNEAVPMVLRRIVQNGCTPKEALTFPKFKNNSTYKSCLDFWKAHGLIPGTDITSRVVIMNYRGDKQVDLDALLSE